MLGRRQAENIWVWPEMGLRHTPAVVGVRTRILQPSRELQNLGELQRKEGTEFDQPKRPARSPVGQRQTTDDPETDLFAPPSSLHLRPAAPPTNPASERRRRVGLQVQGWQAFCIETGPPALHAVAGSGPLLLAGGSFAGGPARTNRVGGAAGVAGATVVP